jgi:hypothetical protein
MILEAFKEVLRARAQVLDRQLRDDEVRFSKVQGPIICPSAPLGRAHFQAQNGTHMISQFSLGQIPIVEPRCVVQIFKNVVPSLMVIGQD